MSNSKSRDTAPAAAPETLDLSGRTIGDFHLLRRLGQGGMGQVYLAEQSSLKRNVALKILRPELASSPTALERFKAEATAVARATHANIVQVYAFGVVDGLAYMALEYVEGRNLKEFIARKGPPDLLVSLSIMRQVASALQRASELGIIHRDIKPENILLTRKGEAKVADFGLVRCLEGEQPAVNLTQTGVTMGTPLYMSPEQVEGKPVDSRTDIYSFGVTCYHMLCGQPPFVGQTAFEVALQHVQKQPVPLAKHRPDLPEMLCCIVHKMMAKDPAQRYQTGKDLLRDIARLRESLSGVVNNTLANQPAISIEQPTVNSATPVSQPAPTTAAFPVPVPRRRRGLLVAFAVMTVLAAAGGGVLFAWQQRLRQGPLPHGEEIAPADATVKENLSLPSKQEQTLRDAVEQYLHPPKGKTLDLAAGGGFGLCADLGLYYLDNHRLADADTLFTRLEAFTEPRSYRMLGQMGKGIVLALSDKPKDSNERFRKVFAFLPVFKGALERKLEKAAPLMKTILSNPRWRYWLARARWYNSQNGLPDNELPFWMRSRFASKDGAPPLRPGGKQPADKARQPKKDKSS